MKTIISYLIIILAAMAIMAVILATAILPAEAANGARYYCPGQEYVWAGVNPLDFDTFIPAQGCTWLPMVSSNPVIR